MRRRRTGWRFKKTYHSRVVPILLPDGRELRMLDPRMYSAMRGAQTRAELARNLRVVR
jgi:hypothetical protein